jgi:hypothetical protein
MVAFLFGDFAGAVDEVQSLFEIGKAKDAVEMMSLRGLPARDLFEKFLNAFGTQFGNSAFARYAVFAG